MKCFKELTELDEMEADDFARNNLGFKKVAIVEDDENAQQLMIYYLQRCYKDYNFEICAISNPVDFFLNHDLSKFDLLILDINLPSYNGFIVGKEFKRANFYHVPILYVSTDKKYQQDYQQYKNQYSSFLLKPFSKKQLLAEIEKFDHDLWSTVRKAG